MVGVEVQSILVDEIKVGQPSSQVRSGNRNLTGESSLQPANHLLDDVIAADAALAVEKRRRENPRAINLIGYGDRAAF